MDRTDSPTPFTALPLFKRRKTFAKSRFFATDDGRKTGTSVPSASLAASTPVLSRLPASIQNLPTEIVFSILGYVLPTVYKKAVEFRRDPNAFYNELTAEFRTVLQETQVSLRRAALVCRAWYPAANELLYLCPFLGSSSSVLSFSRSLRSCLDLGLLVQEVWVFNEDGPRHSDLIGIKRKSTKRVQADFTNTLRELTSLHSMIVCNHGIIDRHEFPIDNILVYALPSNPRESFIPKLSLYGPSTFNQPWTKHPKPNNFSPAQLEHLCIRDIEISPAELKCAPFLPTLPRAHTLQITMFNHSEVPMISSGTLPALRNLEVFRDIFDSRGMMHMRVVPVDSKCVQGLEQLIFVGRIVESVTFRTWADQLLFENLKHLTIGLLHPNEHAFVSEWRLPDHLETLEVVVWHNAKPMKLPLGEMGDAEGVLKALHACLYRNRQSRAFKKLVIRATAKLPSQPFTALLNDLRELCEEHNFTFQLHEGGLDRWMARRLSGEHL